MCILMIMVLDTLPDLPKALQILAKPFLGLFALYKTAPNHCGLNSCVRQYRHALSLLGKWRPADSVDLFRDEIRSVYVLKVGRG
jgi:hypothetical protein